MKKGISLKVIRILCVCILFCLILVGALTPGTVYAKSIWSTMPSPTTTHLYAVWGSSSSDVFAVGEVGTILHYDGNSWSTMPSPTTDFFHDIWGISSSDVFVVGDWNTILHFDGSSWSTMTSAAPNHLKGVWGSSATDVFAVGSYGTILHYDGSSWSTMTSPTTENLRGVWGSSAADVFAVGYTGTILHYDGSSWSTMASPTLISLESIWGSSVTDVFVGTWEGTILHYDGSSWGTMTSPTTNVLEGFWGSSTIDVFAVGHNDTILHYDGSSWSTMTSPTTGNLRDIWGSSATDVFSVGDHGTILHCTINRPPVANSQSVVTNENTPIFITLSAIDPEGDLLTYDIVSAPTHGTLTGTPPDVTYIPAPNYSGDDSFTFKANDSELDSNVAIISITVNFDLKGRLDRMDAKLNAILPMVRTVDLEVIWQEAAAKRENTQVFHIGTTFGGQPVSVSLLSAQGIRVTTTPPPTYENITANAITPGPGFIVVTVTSTDLTKYSFFQFQMVYNDGVADRFGTCAVRNNAFVPLK